MKIMCTGMRLRQVCRVKHSYVLTLMTIMMKMEVKKYQKSSEMLERLWMRERGKEIYKSNYLQGLNY